MQLGKHIQKGKIDELWENKERGTGGWGNLMYNTLMPAQLNNEVKWGRPLEFIRV